MCVIEQFSQNPREEGFKALGVWFTFDGQFIKEIAVREVAARRKCFALQHMLCNKDVELKFETEVAFVMRTVNNVLSQADAQLHVQAQFFHGDETFSQYFSWCGHVAKISTRDPAKETCSVHEQKYCLVA